jgi:hypothetical protein
MADLSPLERRIADTETRLAAPGCTHTRAQRAEQRYLDGLRDALADMQAGAATGLPIEVTAHPRLIEAAAWNADNHTAFLLLLDTIRAACAAQPQRRQWFPDGLLDPPTTTEQRSGEA